MCQQYYVLCYGQKQISSCPAIPYNLVYLVDYKGEWKEKQRSKYIYSKMFHIRKGFASPGNFCNICAEEGNEYFALAKTWKLGR